MRTNASQFMSSTRSRRNPWGNYANGFTGNPPQQGPGYQQGWTHGHGHDWDHDNGHFAGRDNGQGWHGHHWAYGHDKQDNWKHGHHWAYAHGKWDHGHHDKWDHGHYGNWASGDPGNWGHGHGHD